MLRRVYIDNFRCFVNFELGPEQTCLLLGANGSGKSSLFEALWCVRDLTRYGLEASAAFPVFSRTQWDARLRQRFELDVETAGDTFHYVLEIEHHAQRPESQIVLETVETESKPLFRYAKGNVELFRDDHSAGPVFPLSPSRSFLASLEPSDANRRLTSFLNWLDRLMIFQLDPGAVRSSWIAKTEDRGASRNGGNFAAFYRGLVQEYPDIISDIQGDLRECIPSLRHLRLKDLGEGRGLVASFLSQEGKEYELPFALLSDGQAVLVVLYTVLHALATRASALCIDEPDNFLALPEIQPWLARLRDVVEDRDGQVILASHHPEVIDYLAMDSAIQLFAAEGGLIRSKRLDVDREGGLKASEAIARGWET